MLMPAVTFTVYAIVQKVSGGNSFGVAQAFTALTVINILQEPIMTLTGAWASLAAGLACLDRIQAFLLKEKRTDYRNLVSRPITASNTPSSAAESVHEVSEKQEQPWIKVRDADFGWKTNEPIIKAATYDIMPGELTIVVGPVASGKSTMLKALLGETRMFTGSVEFTIPEEIAYCDQDAWLLNRTIKENILAFEDMHQDFYDQVLAACQLTEDLAQLPKADETLIGSQGVSLSGGQKQRVVSVPPFSISEDRHDG